MASRWASERKGCRYMPPGSRLAQTQGTSTPLSARPFLRGLFSLVTGVRASPAPNLRPPVVWWFQGPFKPLAYIFPGFVFLGHLEAISRRLIDEILLRRLIPLPHRECLL